MRYNTYGWLSCFVSTTFLHVTTLWYIHSIIGIGQCFPNIGETISNSALNNSHYLYNRCKMTDVTSHLRHFVSHENLFCRSCRNGSVLGCQSSKKVDYVTEMRMHNDSSTLPGPSLTSILYFVIPHLEMRAWEWSRSHHVMYTKLQYCPQKTLLPSWIFMFVNIALINYSC